MKNRNERASSPGMEQRLWEVLSGKEGNYINPFFWQNGGLPDLIRQEMEAIYQSGIREVCVESRVHPDFLGDGWWETLDVILEEAVRRGMRVWVLDDAHFPTGYANGRVKENPYARKRYLDCYHIDAVGPLKGSSFLIHLEEGEELVAVTAGKKGTVGRLTGVKGTVCHQLTEVLDLTDRMKESLNPPGMNKEKNLGARDIVLYWDVPEGIWTVNVIKVVEGGTGRRDYINTIDKEAVGLLLKTVYEPHYQRYGALFGREFAGFFSDEPEIGNVLSEYGQNARIGIPGETLAWCQELMEMLKEQFGADFPVYLTALWDEVEGVTQSARYYFMDAVTKLYGKNFSKQLGNWCREHGVEYIGHVIEDNGCHSRLGLGTGHFFRALSGQDMSGIDVVLQQIRPGLNNCQFYNIGGKGVYDGRFFHYGLAKLGVSLAHLDTGKRGRTMCEIFGAYGWTEGLKLMKWLTDHMLVRGVNYFVPHAFSMKDFPDRDCPPHFYAQGRNPQFPYFKYLMAYMNRVSHLLQGGIHVPQAAVFYPACAEWMGECDGFEIPGSILMRHQIDYEVLPEEALLGAEIKDGSLVVGQERYRVLLFPRCEYLPDKVLEWCDEALTQGLTIVMDGQAPKYQSTQEGYRNDKLLITEDLEGFLESERFLEGAGFLESEGFLEGTGFLKGAGLREITLQGNYPDLRYYHYRQPMGDLFLFFNEAVGETVETVVSLPVETENIVFQYDAWENRLYRAASESDGVRLKLMPGEATIFYAGKAEEEPMELPPQCYDTRLICYVGEKDAAGDAKPEERENLVDTVPSCGSGWQVSLLSYDGSGAGERHLERLVDLTGSEGNPLFSGKMTYMTEFPGNVLEDDESVLVDGREEYLLDCGEVYETMEVWLNGKSLGVRVAAPYTVRFSREDVHAGNNQLKIEVTNTLVHAMRDIMSMTMPIEPSGLLGPVRILAVRSPEDDCRRKDTR